MMDLNCFWKVSLPKDASSLFSKPVRQRSYRTGLVFQRPNRLLAFGIFLIISALVFRSVSASAHFTVEEAQLFTVPISQCLTSKQLFMCSGLFAMLFIVHPTPENLGFRLFPLYFLPLFEKYLIEIP